MMTVDSDRPSTDEPRRLAEQIFRAAVAAVNSEKLVRNAVRVDDDHIRIGDRTYERSGFDRTVVLGAGKAGAGMAAGLMASLGESSLPVVGQLNVPDNCVRELPGIELVGARPAGRNEPTAAGVKATERLLELARSCGPRDLAIVLLSGGGSALLPAPVEGLSLEAKRSATAMLAASGASIHELNTVRRHLSRIKGGGLLTACDAGVMEVLVISDVVGSDLATIASGPTILKHESESAAMEVFQRYVPNESHWPTGLKQALTTPRVMPEVSDGRPVYHTIIGSNAVAVAAAEQEARKLGCDVVSLGADHVGEAANEGREWARRLKKQRELRTGGDRPLCLIDGGEPVVTLAKTEQRRKGGRNQELVLAAIDELGGEDWSGIALLSGGTDGEDGPTDAAGAVADRGVVAKAASEQLNPKTFLAINNSYPYFEATGGLLITGPTHTNVMDVRVGVIVT